MDDLSVKQAAIELRVSIRTIRNMIGRGSLPGAFKMDPGTRSVWRIPRIDIITIQEQRQQQPKQS